MNHTLRKHWNTALIAILAGLYAWIGLSTYGLDQILGLAGAALILTALTLKARSRATTLILLVIGALPLAIHTWWSVITPLLAILVITLGWLAIRASPTTTPTPTPVHHAPEPPT
jgi:hypothetical protein